MKHLRKFFSALFILLSGPALGQQIVGELVLLPTGCENGPTCRLGQDFGFVDAREKGWQATAGNITDGASIPKWAQRFVGVPFTREYLPAAVLHDHYSKSVRPVNGWFETQQMFYEVLRHSGVEEPRASILFAGVLIGSGKWITRMEGKPCAIGVICVQQTVTVSTVREAESFAYADYAETFERVRGQIEADGVSGVDAVLAILRRERPGDIYLRHTGGVVKLNLDSNVPTFDR